MADPGKVRYLVLDIETVADGELIARSRYPGWSLAPAAAVSRYKEELKQKSGSDFVPHTYQVPVAVCVATVSGTFELLDLVSLDEPKFRPHVIADLFWRGWEKHGRPSLVTFNGRGFDLPVLEHCAFRYGIPVPAWFTFQAKLHEQPRYRFNLAQHFDLMEFLTDFGASRYTGGLNLAAHLLGKPGKGEVEGSMVQGMFDQGKTAEISDYCKTDVLDTYFVFLRTQVLLGNLTLKAEQEIVGRTKKWLEARREGSPAYQDYLKRWGDWPNPWKREDPSVKSEE